ncbi:Serine/Threonine protein kinase [Hyalangium minutum]|uniref:Serine/Threonine protein kinase n=2 Tax=Hyalangium minutum TaxID=394096 RepID=A0A085WC31_9BACT|nr:Serine/Threonine protein kinase [Hyalangium minutum]
MAEVFLARADGPRGFSKTLVLKRILPHLAGDEQFVEMFLSEARLVARINHPNVVQIFDFGEFDGAYYIAMEFIDGPNLRALMRRAGSLGQSIPPALCAKMVASACEGLAHAHELVDPETQKPFGLVHRDVSPDNILIDRNGTVKVVDFGIAKAVGQTHLTKAGMVKGKLPYMPPEQMRGRPLDRRVDVFALGMVLYELLTFRRPFSAKGEADIMEAILHKPMKRLSEYLPGAPEALERIVQRCLAKNREERYPSCRQLRADLERFVLSTGEPVGAEELAALVARLMPASQGPLPADTGTSSSKSSSPQSSPKATPPPMSKPRAPATRTSSPKARPQPPPLPVPPLPEAQEPASVATDRSIILLVNRKGEPPRGEFPVTMTSGEHPAPEQLPENSVEVGLAPTSQVKSQQRRIGSGRLKAALAGSLVAAVSAALLLGRARLSREEEERSVTPVPRRESPEAPGMVAIPSAPSEESEESPSPFVESVPQAEPPAPRENPHASPSSEEAVAQGGEEPQSSGASEELPPAPAASQAQEADADEPSQKEHAEVQKPVAQVRRSKVKAGGGTSGLSRREIEPELVPPLIEVAPTAPPAVSEPAREQPQLATAVLSSSPPAQIRVNGQFVGLSPVTLRNQPPGPLQVEVYDSVRGFSKRHTFVLVPGDNGALHIPVNKGTLELRIHPSAAVILDGKRLGHTPLEPITLYEGTHGLRLENEELGKHLITTVTITPGEATVFQFDFAAGK